MSLCWQYEKVISYPLSMALKKRAEEYYFFTFHQRHLEKSDPTLYVVYQTCFSLIRDISQGDGNCENSFSQDLGGIPWRVINSLFVANVLIQYINSTGVHFFRPITINKKTSGIAKKVSVDPGIFGKLQREADSKHRPFECSRTLHVSL